MSELKGCAVVAIVVKFKRYLACADVPYVVVADGKLIGVGIEHNRFFVLLAALKRVNNTPIICRGNARYREVEVANAAANGLIVMC